ncbi:MAG: hypothetical protein HFI54_14775 [Lachnospiraceae bacterium]|nr:hypothetical protein [Lachnospiraceae bacterium]
MDDNIYKIFSFLWIFPFLMKIINWNFLHKSLQKRKGVDHFQMKRNCQKKFIGVLTAAIALSGSLTLFALHPDASSETTPKSTKGIGKVEGTLSTDVFNVVLPTISDKVIGKDTPQTTIYDFILDPQKLLSSGSAADKYPGKTFEPDATLYFENILGNPTYDYSHTSDPLAIQNKSTMNVDIKLDATLTGMKNIILTGDNAFNNDKNTSVYLSLIDDKGKISSIDKYGAFLRSTLSGRPNAYKTVYDPASNKYKYILKTSDELQNSNISFDDYSFQLTGACNTANSWSKLPDSIAPKITVTWTVSPRPDNKAPSIGKTFYVMTKNLPTTLDVDLGSGDLAATNIRSITFKDPSGTTANTLTTNNYTFSNDSLIFNASYIDSLIDTGIHSRSHTVTFNDSASTQIIVTLTVNDIPPSIEETTYNMENNTPVTVDINMGSGDSGATAIKNITFLMRNGSPATLGTDMYTFADGTLQFTATHINNVLKNGITSREYTITLNDRANTKMKITLTTTGEFPSIETTSSLIMHRNQPLSVDVDLGSGSFAATDIKEITFLMGNGSSATLGTDMYSFAGGILTFNATHINNVINNGIISREYTIVFNNISESKEKITLTAANVAPSISQTSYHMTNGNPVLVDIDMGSGNLGATAVKNITFLMRNGSSATLGTDMYTFANGKLQFTATHISNVLRNGIVSRDYTITLNDKANTKFKITLAVNGRQPSLKTTAPFIMNRDQSVLADIDLGSGDLIASGIKNITFLMGNGSSATLGTNMYSFTNGRLTFTTEHINNVLNNGILSRVYIITLNNIVETQIKITLTAANIAPSISQTSYRMNKDKPVSVKINAGSGNLGATGIKSITFVMGNGSSAILGTNMYTFSGGTLQLTATHINNVLNNGVTLRKYTITMNDKANTRFTITLTN